MSEPLYVNRPIEKENFIFRDKGGRFFLYCDTCQRLTDRNRVEIWSEDGPDGEPAVLKVATTMLFDGVYRRYSPKGSRAFIKMDYYKPHPHGLYYIIQNMLKASEGNRSSKQKLGDDIYMSYQNNGKMIYITKEEFDDPNYDFNI